MGNSGGEEVERVGRVRGREKRGMGNSGGEEVERVGRLEREKREGWGFQEERRWKGWGE